MSAITLFKLSATSGLSAYFVSAFFERQEVGGEQGLVGRHGDVRLYPVPSQSVLVTGLIDRQNGMLALKWSVIR